MQVNFTPIRFNTQYNSTIKPAFKGKDNVDTFTKIETINHDYKVKHDYLSELKDEMRLSGMTYKKLDKELERKRVAEISYIAGEDYEDDDDFIEKMTY